MRKKMNHQRLQDYNLVKTENSAWSNVLIFKRGKINWKMCIFRAQNDNDSTLHAMTAFLQSNYLVFCHNII